MSDENQPAPLLPPAPGEADLPASRQTPAVTPSVQVSASLPASPGLAGLAPGGLPDFAAVYAAHFGYVWTCLRRLGVWERDLDDAVHDVFLVVHRRRDAFDASRPLKPWLAGIATRVASEFRRRAQHRHENVSDDGEIRAVSTHPSPEGIAVDAQRRALVLLALDALSFDRRTVLVLHDIDGHAMPEIAEALGVSVNTLYSRLRAARTDFASAVAAHGPGGSP